MNFKLMRSALVLTYKRKQYTCFCAIKMPLYDMYYPIKSKVHYLEVWELGCSQCENKPGGRRKRGGIKLKAKQLNEMWKLPNCVNQMY